MKSLRIVLWGAFAMLSVPVAQAQDGGPATGFALWTRISGSNIHSLAGSAVGSPQFAVGYQWSGFSLGLGVGLSTLRVTDTDAGSEQKTTATLWQLGPSALINFWHSPDRMTRGNVSLEATYGRVSATDKSSFSGSPTSERKASGGMIGVRLGIGGDHFFGEHFGVGTEVGFQGTFATDITEDGTTQSFDVSAKGAYGALRVTLVF